MRDLLEDAREDVRLVHFGVYSLHVGEAHEVRANKDAQVEALALTPVTVPHWPL